MLEWSAAVDAWNQRGASLEDVERFIHDGVPLDQLTQRADAYVSWLISYFPWAQPKPGAVVLEIGSGVGYLMQAALSQLDPARIVGLDAADGMIAHARARLARDGITDERIEFVHYDGRHISFADNSVDFVYSVASLQHIPRLLVYNLLFEIKRILKPTGYLSAQIMAFSHFIRWGTKQEQMAEFRGQTEGQIRNKPFGWVTFYSFEELLYVLSCGVDVKDIHILEKDGNLWFSFGKDRPNSFHYSWLPDLTRQAIRGQLSRKCWASNRRVRF